jgi:hypothetical protein
MAHVTPKPSPAITALSWGRIEVDGVQRYKDAKLYPGGSRAWDWSETGTHHRPGIQPADVQELLDRAAQAVVLSQGMWRRLGVCKETLDLLEAHRVSVHVVPTPEAVELYNRLREEEAVAGLFHSTC